MRFWFGVLFAWVLFLLTMCWANAGHFTIDGLPLTQMRAPTKRIVQRRVDYGPGVHQLGVKIWGARWGVTKVTLYVWVKEKGDPWRFKLFTPWGSGSTLGWPDKQPWVITTPTGKEIVIRYESL